MRHVKSQKSPCRGSYFPRLMLSFPPILAGSKSHVDQFHRHSMYMGISDIYFTEFWSHWKAQTFGIGDSGGTFIGVQFSKLSLAITPRLCKYHNVPACPINMYREDALSGAFNAPLQ